jgi:hypothetical protein
MIPHKSMIPLNSFLGVVIDDNCFYSIDDDGTTIIFAHLVEFISIRMM